MLNRVHLRRLLQPGAILMAAAIVLPLLLFASAAWLNYQLTLREAVVRADRTARVLEEHALKVIETQALVVEQIQDRLKTIDWSSERDRSTLHDLLVRLQTTTDQVTTITITDASGHMRASGRVFPADPKTDFSDREWFKAVAAGGDRALPFISEPFIGRQTSRRVFSIANQVPRDREGRFDGAISASIDQSLFETFYQDVEPELDHSVTLAREDGVILVREPPTDQTNLATNPDMLRRMQSGLAGHYKGVSPLDGVKRIYSYRKVGAYPVYVRFGISIRAALAPWYDNLLTYGLVSAIASLALIAASALAVRQTAREAAARERWAATAAELRSEVIERASVEEQLRQAQKMEAVGRLTGGVAHDFNNLLTVVIGNLDLLQRRSKSTDASHATLIVNALDGANRAAALTQSLLAFSRQQPLAPKHVDANNLVAGMSDILARTLNAEVAIETILAPDLWLTLVDPNQLESAVLNLAVNARDAMPEGGRLTITTANTCVEETCTPMHRDVDTGSYVTVAVGDTGLGMPPDVIARVFEPFFTTKPQGKGTGLGLSQVYGFVKQSGGHLSIHSDVGVGTIVKLYLPRLEAGTTHQPEVATAEISHMPRQLAGTILVVEDNDAVRAFAKAALEEAGYDVLEAEDGSAALRLLDQHPGVALLFTDVVLGGPMNGRVLADTILARAPDLPILFTTGYTRDAIIHDGRLDDGVNLIGKPFTASALAQTVERLIGGAKRKISHRPAGTVEARSSTR